MLVETLAWAATAATALIAISQLARATWHPVLYVLQALTVHAGVLSLVLAVVALVTGRPALGIVNAVLVVAVGRVVVPMIRVGGRADQAIAGANATLTVLHANTYYDNHRVERAAEVVAEQAAHHDVDVIVISEYAPELERALTALLGASYRYRAGETSSERDGLGVLSRLPISDVRFVPYRWEPAVELHVSGIRLIAVHPGTGLNRKDLREWQDDLGYIADRATAAGPSTMVVGDFNASRWHPPFRDVLDRGFVDVHERLGKGFTSSWPVSRWRPRFVRLDHALVDAGLTPRAVADFRIPGSDHTGFVATVEIRERPASR